GDGAGASEEVGGEAAAGAVDEELLAGAAAGTAGVGVEVGVAAGAWPPTPATITATNARRSILLPSIAFERKGLVWRGKCAELERDVKEEGEI
ncbi:hypothetical protein LINGRAHAP2_LOCUS8799, partial [Linum grandiflorum]